MRRVADEDAGAYLLLLEAKRRGELARAGARHPAGRKVVGTPRPSDERGRVEGLGALALRLLKAVHARSGHA